jgi:hypothetical protein
VDSARSRGGPTWAVSNMIFNRKLFRNSVILRLVLVAIRLRIGCEFESSDSQHLKKKIITVYLVWYGTVWHGMVSEMVPTFPSLKSREKA